MPVNLGQHLISKVARNGSLIAVAMSGKEFKKQSSDCDSCETCADDGTHQGPLCHSVRLCTVNI